MLQRDCRFNAVSMVKGVVVAGQSKCNYGQVKCKVGY